MANSKYEYVKKYETEDSIFPCNWIVVRIKASEFHEFSSIHEFEKPNDASALNLMNSCAESLLAFFPDVIFAYGAGHEYSFVLRKDSDFYKRRASKIVSLFVSFVTSLYVRKWREFFPSKDLKAIPYFHGRAFCFPAATVLRDYLASRQDKCHTKNLYNTCFWMLAKSGKSEEDAQLCLKGTQVKEKNEMLFQQFGINYDKLPRMFRKGSCVFRKTVAGIVQKDGSRSPRKSSQKERKKSRKIITVEHVNIIGPGFWEEHPYILQEDILCTRNGEFECVKKFELVNKMPLSNWIIVRIDGCHFHQFTAIHGFEKPNDANALSLMDNCAQSLLAHYKDVVFAYGTSDEYSFLLKEATNLYDRQSSRIISSFVSYFTSAYVMTWNKFFPSKDLERIPYFDCRAVCYSRANIIRDYFAWRQVDCHINNQYNTCFWMLVKSGKSKKEAYSYLQRTQAKEKNEMLFRQFGINYEKLPAIFRKGSCIFKNMVEEKEVDDSGNPGKRTSELVTVDHFDIIGPKFWDEHPYLLKEDGCDAPKTKIFAILFGFLMFCVFVVFFWYLFKLSRCTC